MFQFKYYQSCLVIILLIFSTASLSTQTITPLSTACFHKNEVLITSLIDSGADPDLLSINQLLQCSDSSETRMIETLKRKLQQNNELDSIRSLWDMYSLCEGSNGPDVKTFKNHIDSLITKTDHYISLGLNINSTDEKGRNALIAASRSCPTSIVSHLVKMGADINYVANNMETALIRSTSLNEANVIRLLISTENINKIDELGDSALHKVAESNIKEVAELLIKSGANVNLVNKSGLTPLLVASKSGDLGVAQSLIDAGAELNRVNDKGDTALILSAREDNYRIIKALIDAGADVNVTNELGETAQMLSIRHQNSPAVDLMLSHGGVIPAENIEVTFRQALESGNILAIKSWLYHLPDMTLKNEAGESILHWQNIIKNKEILGVLVEAGADITVLNKQGETVLQHYLNLGKWRDNNYTRKVRYKRTPYLKIVELLANASKTVINNIDSNDKTALVSVVSNKEIRRREDLEKLLKILLNAGADINLINKAGSTTLQLALPYHRDILIKYGANVNAIDKDNVSELMSLSVNKQRHAVYAAISAGADVNHQANDGTTALMLAVEAQEPYIIDALIQAGSDINLRDNNGRTAWHRAVGLDEYTSFLDLLVLDPIMTDQEHSETEELLMSQRFEVHRRQLTPADGGIKKTGWSGFENLDIFDQVLSRVNAEHLEAVLKFAPKIYTTGRLNQELYRDRDSGDKEVSILTILQKYGGDINVTNSHGYSPLALAIYDKWDDEDIRDLLHAGANPDVKGVGGINLKDHRTIKYNLKVLKKEKSKIKNHCEKTNKDRRFVNIDGMVLDQLNKTLWKQCPENIFTNDCSGIPSIHTQLDSIKMAGKAKYDEKYNWRLPSDKELKSLYAINCKTNKKELNTEVFSKIPEAGYWSSTPSEYNRIQKQKKNYWINLKNGRTRDSSWGALQHVWFVHDWDEGEMEK